MSFVMLCIILVSVGQNESAVNMVESDTVSYRQLLGKCVEYTEFDKYHHTPDFSLPFWKKFAAMCENDQISRVSSSLFLKTSWKHPC